MENIREQIESEYANLVIEKKSVFDRVIDLLIYENEPDAEDILYSKLGTSDQKRVDTIRQSMYEVSCYEKKLQSLENDFSNYCKVNL